jgi:hypothetical protein
MRNTARKIHHAYMYSYDREVGSFDPDMEEPQNWEAELGSVAHFPSVTFNKTFSSRRS